MFKTINRCQNIFQTEASIVTELGKERGRITKLAGAVDKSGFNFYLSLEDWKHFPLHLIPTLEFDLKVDVSYNYLKITSSNKDISPLKKGDVLTLYFDDSSLIEKDFIAGRVNSGKAVINYILLSDLELIHLAETSINSIVVRSGIEMPFGITNVSNNQYATPSDGKALFKIISQRIIGVKLLLLKKGGVNGGNFSSFKGFLPQ